MTSREEICELSKTIDAAVAAVRGHDCIIDVVVNGNPALAEAAAAYLRSREAEATKTRVRVWHLVLGDKAHCINESIHRIWPGSEIAFFVDGYAAVAPGAMRAIAESLQRAPAAVAACGVPTVGRSAGELTKTLLTAGGMTGALFAIRSTTMDELRRRGVRLPLGMYRTDGTMAATFYFNLDPGIYEWDLDRIAVCSDATFYVRPKSVWRMRDLRGQLDRLVRLAWGAFITRAVRAHLAIRRRRPEDFPETAFELVLGWAREHPWEAIALAARRPLVAVALWRARYGRDWSARAIPPKIVHEGFV